MADALGEGAHIVVTGGASGIGLACVEALIDRGASVTLLDAGGEDVAACEDRFDGEDVFCVRADVTDEEEITDAFSAAADEFGPVTGLVCAAGILRAAAFEATSAELFRQVVDVNLTGAFIAGQAALDHMGDALAIVNVASVSGLRANAGRSAYGASKAGLIMLSQVMAVELGASGIRVNCVAPGAVNTQRTIDTHSAEDRTRWAERVPQRRYGQPDEVAAAIVFLLSDAANYINGQVLAVDGGFSVAGLMQAATK